MSGPVEFPFGNFPRLSFKQPSNLDTLKACIHTSAWKMHSFRCRCQHKNFKIQGKWLRMRGRVPSPPPCAFRVDGMVAPGSFQRQHHTPGQRQKCCSKAPDVIVQIRASQKGVFVCQAWNLSSLSHGGKLGVGNRRFRCLYQWQTQLNCVLLLRTAMPAFLDEGFDDSLHILIR